MINGWLMVLFRIRMSTKLAQGKEGSRGAVGHGVMVAAAGRPGQVWLWGWRQAGAPSGIPSGVGVQRLQPARLRVWLCRPNPLHPHDRRAGHGSVVLFAFDNPPNASAGGIVITCSPGNQVPVGMKHRLTGRLP